MTSSAGASPSSPRWAPCRTAPSAATRRQRSSESSAGQFRGSHSSRLSPPSRRHAAEKSNQLLLRRFVRFIRSDQGLRPVPDPVRGLGGGRALEKRFAAALQAPDRGVERDQEVVAFHVYCSGEQSQARELRG